MEAAINLYTDGSCLSNPGPGGWATIIKYPNGITTELTGGEINTTNNRMELMAAIKGLEEIPSDSNIVIFSDSQYLINAFTKGWLDTWVRNEWRNSSGFVKNKDLWERMYTLVRHHKSVQFVWVKGHAGHPENELCDKLARSKSQLYKSKGE